MFRAIGLNVRRLQLARKKRAYFALAISGTGIEGTHEGVF